MSKQMKHGFKKQAAVLLIASLLAGMFPVFVTLPARAAEHCPVSNPRIDSDGVTTWDCIWFGNYWQGDTNGDGKADKSDKKTPIKWRVLSVEGDDAFLLADKNLDCQKYNNTKTDVTWETCTIRSWLNGYGAEQNVCRTDYQSENFMKNAFTREEQEAILTTDVVNRDNPDYQTPGGNNTKDQVYLLSREETTNPEYGFTSSIDVRAGSRMALNTDFVKGQIAEFGWWLRSPGFNNCLAALVGNIGNLPLLGNSVNVVSNAVRPALHLNLASVTSDAYAGTVTSKEETETPPSPNVTSIPTGEPEETSAPQLTYDLKVKTSGDGAVMLKTAVTTVTTDGNASIDMKINSGEEVLLTFQPAEGSASYTVTLDGEEWQGEGNVYRIPDMQNSHTIEVTFAAPATPTPPVITPTSEPLEPTEIPSSPEPAEPTKTPSSPEPAEPTETPSSPEPAEPTGTPSSPEPAEPTGTPSSTEGPAKVSPTPVPQPSRSPVPEKDISAIGDGLGVPPETAAKIQAAAKKLNVSLDTILVTEQTIQSQKTDEDIRGSYFARLQARASQITERNIKLTWNRVKGADGYEVYGNRCNTKKWIYKYKRKQTIENGNKRSYIDRKCKKGTYYKYFVRAYKIIDGKKVTIAASKTIHVTTKGGKNGNAKAVKVNKGKVSIKKGKTWQIRAREIKESKPLRHHREVSFESSRPQAVSVSQKGVIKAKKKGKCTIFAYAQSGVYRKIRVTVK